MIRIFFFERAKLDHSVLPVYVRKNDQLAGVVFLTSMEDTTCAVGDSNQLPLHTLGDSLTGRRCFATTVSSTDVRPMASASHDTTMTVDTSKGYPVYEEEVLAWDALGEVWKKSGLRTR